MQHFPLLFFPINIFVVCVCGRWNDPLALGEALDISQSGGRAIWYPSVDL